MIIERAQVGDIGAIEQLVHEFDNVLLGRTRNDIACSLLSWVVVRQQGIHACASLKIHWTGNAAIGEIRSLAVRKDMQLMGLGTQLVHQCETDAHSLGIKNMFAMTYVPDFFVKLGYKLGNRDDVPAPRVWSDCVNCRNFPGACTEHLMTREL